MRKILFLIIACVLHGSIIAQNEMQLKTGFYYVFEKSDSAVLIEGKRDTAFVSIAPILTVAEFNKTKIKKTKYGYSLQIILSKTGKEMFSDATAKWINKKIAFVINNQIVMAPVVKEKISTKKIIITETSFEKEELLDMKEKLDNEINATK